MVTLEPIGHLGVAPAFWNLPTRTPDDTPISYFTFRDRWPLYLHERFHVVAVAHGEARPGQFGMRLLYIDADDLPDDDDGPSTPSDDFLGEVGGFVSLDLDYLDAFIAWLDTLAPSLGGSEDAARRFEPVDIEALTALGIPPDTLRAHSFDGQPFRRYLYHPDDEVREHDTFSVVTVGGWTSPLRGSALQSVRFDSYTPDVLRRIHDSRRKHSGARIPFTETRDWQAFLGYGDPWMRLNRPAVAALAERLRGHVFPRSE